MLIGKTGSEMNLEKISLLRTAAAEPAEQAQTDPLGKKAFLLGIYLAPYVNKNESYWQYTRGETMATLDKAAEKSSLNLFPFAQALRHSKETGEPLANSIVFSKYLEENPAEKKDIEKAFERMKQMLAREVEDAINSEPLPEESLLAKEQKYFFNYIMTPREKLLKFKSGKENYDRTVAEWNQQTEEINKKKREAGKLAQVTHDKKVVQAFEFAKIDDKEQGAINMLRNNGASEMEVKDIRREAYFEKKRLELLQQTKGVEKTGFSTVC